MSFLNGVRDLMGGWIKRECDAIRSKTKAYITIAIRARLEFDLSMLRTLFEKCIRARFYMIR